MRVLASIIGILVLLVGSLLWGQARPPRDNRRGLPAQPQNPADFAPDPPPVGQPAPTPQPPASVPAQPVPPTAPAASPAPTPAVAPENLPPPTAPQVTFHDGLLTVLATNSNLSALLTAIRNKTGIQFEGMDNSNERVAISMGPAPEGDVLTAILDGSRFDYVVLERPDSPGIVQRVLLTPKGGSAAANAVPGATQTAAKSSGDADDDDDDASEEPAAPQDTAVRPPVAQVTPQQPTQPPQQAQPRSADQMYEELKKGQAQQPQPSPSPNTAPIKPH